MALSCSDNAKVRSYTVKVVADYPHDASAYTQGLFFKDGRLYESTGLAGRSTLRRVDLETGVVLERKDFRSDIFAEGSVFFRDSLYVLSWQNNLAFKYDISTFELGSAWTYPREGWGLTTDGGRLIASDGSAWLYFLDENFVQTGKVLVKKNGIPVRWLNELEYIDGRVWANVYTTDEIVIIDPSSGVVEGSIDCSGLLPQWARTASTDVLNGIARDDVTGKIYLTGKNWPRLYEVKLVPVK